MRNVVGSAQHERLATRRREQTIGGLLQLRGRGSTLRGPRNRLLRRAGDEFDQHAQRRSDLVRRGHDALVGVGSGERQARLELRVVREVPIGIAAGAIRPRELDGRDPRAEEVGVERNDDLGAIQPISRDRAHPEQFLVRVEQGRRGKRIDHHVTRSGERREELVDRSAFGRAMQRSGQEAHLAAALPDRAEVLNDLLVDRLPGTRVAGDVRPVQTVRVVQPEHVRLPRSAETAAGHRVARIAFDLDRPPVAALREHAAARVATATQRGVPVGAARRHLGRFVEKRNRVIGPAARTARSGDTRGESREL